MSHFIVFAVVPEGPEIEERIDALMQPYSENTEVPEYDDRCWCVGRIAANDGSAAAEKAHPMDALRKLFAEKHPLPEGKDASDLTAEEEEPRRRAWEQFMAPRIEVERKTIDDHPKKSLADPACDECKGTGSNKSTSNPQGHWDWYRVGGRWDGTVAKVKVESKDNGFNFGDEHASLERNSLPVSRVLDAWEPKDAPFALLTPDGKWHQRARMGWWGMTSRHEMPIAEWREKVRAMLADYAVGHIVVGLDCHV